MKIFDVEQDTLKMLAQTLQEVKRYARNVENGCEGLEPLCLDSDVRDQLNSCVTMAHKIGDKVTVIYNRIAREAFQKRELPDSDMKRQKREAPRDN